MGRGLRLRKSSKGLASTVPSFPMNVLGVELWMKVRRFKFGYQPVTLSGLIEWIRARNALIALSAFPL